MDGRRGVHVHTGARPIVLVRIVHEVREESGLPMSIRVSRTVCILRTLRT